MKNYLYGIFAIAFLAFTACTNEELPTPGTGQDTPVEHKSGEILVKFSPYVSEILDKAAAATRSGGPATRSGILSVDEVLDIVGGYQIERVFPVDGRNEERTRESELHCGTSYASATTTPPRRSPKNFRPWAKSST